MPKLLAFFMRGLLLIICLIPSLYLQSQIPDSILVQEEPDTITSTLLKSKIDSIESMLPVDSSLLEKEKNGWFFKASDYPNPNRALIYSFIVPGAGQFYNKKWYKIPIVYGGLFGLGYWVHTSTNNYLIYERAYRRKVRGLPHDFTGTSEDSETTLRSFRDQFDKNRQTSYIIFFVGYTLVAIEAFVDAHLAEFDVSDDLSFKLKPSLEPVVGSGPALGVGVRVEF